MRGTVRLLTLLMMLAPAALAAQQAPPLATFDSAWTAMARSYFDTALVQGRWRASYDSLRRTLGATPTLDEERGALRALIQVPGQSHFALIPADALPTARTNTRSANDTPGTSGLVPRLAADTLIVWRVEPGSAAATASIRPGDALIEVDGTAVDSLRARLRRAFPRGARESDALLLQFVQSQLNGAVGDSVHLTTVGLDGRRRAHTLVHGAMPGRVSRYGNLPPMVVRAALDTTQITVGPQQLDIPILSFSAWFPVIIQDLDRFAFSARGAPGVIIDLRGNLGGAVGIIGGFAGHFSDSSWSLGTMRGRGADLRLAANPRRATAAGERVGVITAPVAILIDGMTASASEFFAAGMQALGRARVFGENSAGQSLPAAMLRLPSGDVLMHPIADHEDASGRRIEGRGVVPDTPTPLVRSALGAGRDPALDAARAWLAEALARP
jgi:carboxyl-terminal processing protease